jgi:hypothetical protein
MSDDRDVVYFRMCDEDRETYGGPEWGELDVTRLMDSRAGWLERIERTAGGFPVERMIAELNTPWPGSRAVRMAMWLGRKQTGDATVWTADGKPESWDAFDPRTLRARLTGDPVEAGVAGEEEADADPLPEAPAGEVEESPATT